MKVLKNIPLSSYTTWKIGGPAQYLIQANNGTEFVEAIKYGRKNNLPITVLGGASNVLVSDKGIEGLVVINKSRQWRVVDGEIKDKSCNQEIRPRQVQLEEKIRFENLFYNEDNLKKVRVRVDSGVNITWLIQELLKRGITGLHWFVGIPGTVGGGVYNNIHAGHLFLGDFVSRIEVLDKNGKVKLLETCEFGFDYDQSRFHKSGEIILSIDFDLYYGDTKKAKQFIETWLGQRDIKYPLPSAGCVFKNIDKKTQEKLNLPTPSWGYIIDKVLGLKGKQIGGAVISDKHSAFIVNKSGKAKAKDVLALIELVKKESMKKLAIQPELEIFLLGNFNG